MHDVELSVSQQTPQGQAHAHPRYTVDEARDTVHGGAVGILASSAWCRARDDLDVVTGFALLQGEVVDLHLDPTHAGQVAIGDVGDPHVAVTSAVARRRRDCCTSQAAIPIPPTGISSRKVKPR